MILSSGRKSKKGITTIKETDEMLTSRAGLGFTSQYIYHQMWLMKMFQACGDMKGSSKGLHSGEQLRHRKPVKVAA